MVKLLDRLGIHFAHNIIMQVNLGMDTAHVEQIGPRGHQWEHFDMGLSRGNVLGWGSTFHQKSGECHNLQR